MNKRTRLIIILAVIAVCFAFLWPTISWYGRTSKEDQALALSSLESIRDYSMVQAALKVDELIDSVKADPNQEVPKDLNWLAKIAKKNYKESGEKVPDPLTLKDVMSSFGSLLELTNAFESKYRSAILKNKKNFNNSVKLGLDLSGGMSVVVKADLDAVVANQEGDFDAVTLKSEAMTQAIETLTSRIDRFGLSSPTIRQQGEDRIYIELPGSAEVDQINSIIQGRGILNFRLVDFKLQIISILTTRTIFLLHSILRVA